MTDENLQFDRAESVAGGPPPASCSRCQRPITGSYFQVNAAIVCSQCRQEIEAEWNRGTSASRFARALGLGILAAAAGAAIYFAIAALTGYVFSLVAIVVGLMVGVAVKKGSNGRGGWRYQALAIFLTYTSIVSSYAPQLFNETMTQVEAARVAEPGDESTDRAPPPKWLLVVITLVLTFGFAYAVPFLGGTEGLLGLLIIGIGLYEAWKLNQRATLTISGPYQVA